MYGLQVLRASLFESAWAAAGSGRTSGPSRLGWNCMAVTGAAAQQSTLSCSWSSVASMSLQLRCANGVVRGCPCADAAKPGQQSLKAMYVAKQWTACVALTRLQQWLPPPQRGNVRRAPRRGKTPAVHRVLSRSAFASTEESASGSTGLRQLTARDAHLSLAR